MAYLKFLKLFKVLREAEVGAVTMYRTMLNNEKEGAHTALECAGSPTDGENKNKLSFKYNVLVEFHF